MDVKQRICLRCGKAFESAGPANRICRRCGQVNARLPITEEQLQQQRGVKRRNGEPLPNSVEDDISRAQANR